MKTTVTLLTLFFTLSSHQPGTSHAPSSEVADGDRKGGRFRHDGKSDRRPIREVPEIFDGDRGGGRERTRVS